MELTGKRTRGATDRPNAAEVDFAVRVLAPRFVALSLMSLSCCDRYGLTEKRAALRTMKRCERGKLPSPEPLGANVEPPDTRKEYCSERDEDWHHGLRSPEARNSA